MSAPAKTELIPIEKGDVVTWKGPRNFAYREMSGVVKHVGKIFARVQPKGRGEDTLIKRALLLSRTPPLHHS